MSDSVAGGSPRPLVLFGAGSLARLALAYFTRDTDHRVVACAVDAEHVDSARLEALPTVPFDALEVDYPPTECSLFVAIGYSRVNRGRAEVFERCRALGYRMPTLVSSRAYTWADLTIGANCLVFDGVVVEPSVEIGDDVIVWSGSQISHDTVIGDHCFLGPNAVVLGDVSLGERTFVGGNATIRNGLTIESDCVVGAGAVVKWDAPAGAVFSADPTRPSDAHSSTLIDL